MYDGSLEFQCSHVAPKECGFRARMRFHQSWYRRHVLNLPPGPNPHACNELYGSMLCKEDGLAGGNFVNAVVHAFAEQRIALDDENIEVGRLRNNMLASQTMCFNLFASLAVDMELATRLIVGLPGMEQVARVTDVRLEYAPPKETHLKDRTSFDAWVEYERANGMRGFLGIETKLTEPFSQNHYDFGPGYRRWQEEPSWWWVPGAEAHFSDKRYNQLWRNHLLAFAHRHQPETVYSECFSAVISHPKDNGCNNSINAYEKHLLPEGRSTLLEWPLDDLVRRWMEYAKTAEEQDWLQSLYLRYLDLEASEASWQRLQTEPEEKDTDEEVFYD